METKKEKSKRGPLKEIGLLFFKLGCIAFGGPAAHISMMDDSAFLDAVNVASVGLMTAVLLLLARNTLIDWQSVLILLVTAVATKVAS